MRFELGLHRFGLGIGGLASRWIYAITPMYLLPATVCGLVRIAGAGVPLLFVIVSCFVFIFMLQCAAESKGPLGPPMR